MSKTKIFISYHHKDEMWKDRLVSHLKVLELEGGVEVWDDRQLESGSNWIKTIKENLIEANIAVLLISADFLTSVFIRNEEIPVLLNRRKEEGIVVFPIILKPCAWVKVEWLRKIQVYPKDGRPLSKGSAFEIDHALAEITMKLADFFKITSIKKAREISFTSTSIEKIDEKQKKAQFFISHCNQDGDFAELLKLRIEKEGYTSWIDIDRLSVGIDWRQEIDNGIKDSSALIVIMTPEARKSEYVTYEWAFAWGMGVKVIPIMLKQTQMHPRLETLQHLDFTNREARPWQKLIKTLKEAINKKSLDRIDS
jgi:hypothetical protein